MAASCTNFNSHTNTASFCVSDKSELSKLPTTADKGKEELEYIKSINAGSDCIVIADSSVFMLDGNDNTWKEI